MNDKSPDPAFDRTKIYEKLEYEPEPPGYDGLVPWVVQQHVAGSNGNHYRDLVGKLKEIPIPTLPAPGVAGGLMLDVGCGWGRWLVAGARKGFIPVGVDLRVGLCKTSKTVLSRFGLQGYTVAADVRALPFASGVFDLAWSFSTLQHVHKDRFVRCLESIRGLLAPGGACLIEIPNRGGVRNRLLHVGGQEKTADDYDSWCVRYYSIDECRKLFGAFEDFRCRTHSFFGTGVLPSDLRYVTLRNKLPVLGSVCATLMTEVFPPLTAWADSLYVSGRKGGAIEAGKARSEFLKAHQAEPWSLQAFLRLLRCPVSGGELTLEGEELRCESSRLAYPVVDGVPVLIASEARRL